MTKSDKAVMQQALDFLIESARLLGTTQAAKLCGIYTQTDSMFEHACHEIIEAKTQTILEAIAQPEQTATDKLLTIIAASYQIAGACDIPAHILDVLANPEIATQEQIDAMLPFVQTAQEINAWRVSGTNRLYEQHNAEQEARRCGGSARAYPVYAEPQSVHPATERNFCSRCGKRLGGIDDVHTCTPAQQKETK